MFLRCCFGKQILTQVRYHQTEQLLPEIREFRFIQTTLVQFVE